MKKVYVWCKALNTTIVTTMNQAEHMQNVGLGWYLGKVPV